MNARRLLVLHPAKYPHLVLALHLFRVDAQFYAVYRISAMGLTENGIVTKMLEVTEPIRIHISVLGDESTEPAGDTRANAPKSTHVGHTDIIIRQKGCHS